MASQAATSNSAPHAAAAVTTVVTPKDQLDIAFSGLNGSIGWVPGVGTAINGVKFGIDSVNLVTSLLTLDLPQAVTELGNLVVDSIGLVPVVGAPIASLLYQTALGGNIKFGAFVQESLQGYLNSDSTWSQYQFSVDAVDIQAGLGGSQAGTATVSTASNGGSVMMDITNTGFDIGWSIPLEGRLQLLGIAFNSNAPATP